MDLGAFDEVLRARPPRFTAKEASEIAGRAFGMEGQARSLGSERDQTFLVEGLAKGRGRKAIMKVSNSAENQDTLDMEALAAIHAHEADPTLPIALPWVAPGADPDSDGAAAFRVRIEAGDGSHFVRVYDFMAGRASVDESILSDEALRFWGETLARLSKAMQGFDHAAADRVMLWDVQHALLVRPLVPAIEDPRARDTVTRVLDRYDEVVAPVWPSLRSQILHGDLTADNVLMDKRGFICGIIDFGDMSRTAVVTDLASALGSAMSHRRGLEATRAARILVDGYRGVIPLEADELRILGELVAARIAAGIAIESWRAAQSLQDVEIPREDIPRSLGIIESLEAVGYEQVAAGWDGSA